VYITCTITKGNGACLINKKKYIIRGQNVSNVKFTQEQATKAQRGSRRIAFLFL